MLMRRSNTIRARHPLVGLFLAEVTALLDGADKLARSKALAFMRELVWKHDLDPRYQDPEAKALITAMYFPFLLTVRTICTAPCVPF